jgi:cell fate regulator YaaT (PSP1 superfamily)
MIRRLFQEFGERLELPFAFVGVDCADPQRWIVFFYAEGRFDFREMVRLLASHSGVRIELRQVGPREQASMVGGLGVCGRELCCSSFFRSFEGVPVRMAEKQGALRARSENTGMCGRLKCCLAFERPPQEQGVRP